jgi:hypothetical protein
MASLYSAFACAIAGLVLWTGVGWVFARRLPLGGALALPLAPALGWAIQNVVALALSRAVGFSFTAILGAAALACGAALLVAAAREDEPDARARIPIWIYALAALVALGPALAVLPKFTTDGVILAPAIFDHSKVTLIDQMVREGVPPANPVFGGDGASAGVAYYYLWHFGAAQLARLTDATGWEADIAATWFTAFSSLCLMSGLAFGFHRRAIAPLFVLVACATGSLRPVLEALFGQEALDRVLRPATGFAGWLFQSSWSPHHVAAAGCVVIATLLMVQLALRPSVLVTAVLALVAAAGFQSSIWVGGVTFALAGVGVVLVLLCSGVPGGRYRFLAAVVVAALIAAVLAMPLLIEQYHAALARGGGSPVLIEPYHVLGPAISGITGRILDLPAYWLVPLLVEFPVAFVAGPVMLRGLVLKRIPQEHDDIVARTLLMRALAVLALVSVCGSWLLVSTAGDNNDLGWRAILPGLIVLTAAGAAGAASWLERRAWPALALVLAATIAALPAGAVILSGNLAGKSSPSAAAFAQAPAMWRAVRQHARPDARVASNPLLFGDMTPWPVNISWALLADRRSCFAGNELAIAFAPLSAERRAEISDRFARVFDGQASDIDLRALTGEYSCDVVLLTVRDGAWERDPFATSPHFRLVEARPGEWRIYVAAAPAAPPALP